MDRSCKEYLRSHMFKMEEWLFSSRSDYDNWYRAEDEEHNKLRSNCPSDKMQGWDEDRSLV